MHPLLKLPRRITPGHLHVSLILLACLLCVHCAKQSYAPAKRYSPAPAPAPMEEAAVAKEVAAEPGPGIPAERMVHYNGYAELRVTKASEVLDAAVKLAEAAGGRVESLDMTRATLRVPVSKFHEVFKAVLDLGDVLDKEITAEDVTEAFMDVDMRLQASRTARKRFVELLARATEEEEKIAILREIQRLTEEIERLENCFATLKSLAAFSRITVLAIPRERFQGRALEEEIAEFRWILDLSPFRREHKKLWKRLEFEPPDGMALLNKKGRWIAESADGAVFWTRRQKNKPGGDTGFWLEAIRFRLAPEFASTSVETAGEFKILRFVDKSDEPYIYLVGVLAEKDRLMIIEIFFPSEAQEKRYKNDIFESIEKGIQ